MISAVVVHFRGRPLLDRCVQSCLASGGIDEVLIVDNEGVGQELCRSFADPRVRVIGMRSNVGYGRAANEGIALSTGRSVLVLNQDVELRPDAAELMARAAAASGAWLVGPRLIGPDGATAAAKETFPPPLRWRGTGGSGPGWTERPWIPGAAMLLADGHTDLRFDGRLFMYGEDEELCWRVWASGGRVVEADNALVLHQGGSATGQRWTRAGIAARTVVNRLRIVRWHRGWGAAARYAGAMAQDRVTRRLGRSSDG